MDIQHQPEDEENNRARKKALNEVILGEEAKIIFEELEAKAKKFKAERMLLKGILQKAEILKIEAHYGNPIAKHLIPWEYRMKNDANHLFRLELPLFWRMPYTITSEREGESKIVILDILNHKDYDKKFG
ncbi:MAG: hypothetical protein Q7S65_04280 [Nanoarchaeota archaeon]|nr:hypothetical protein [Nanoarchaeota archaeon]